MKPRYWLMPLLLLVTFLVYANGLNGPFLFDDHVHITQNRWVKIESLAWSELVRAWNSSLSAFPSNRPLAQLSFGINHALSGLDPWAFKITNLLIHLTSGVLVFVFSRLVLRAVAAQGEEPPWRDVFAALVTAAWLLHPLHVSTVMYTVQRMAQLSTLGLLAALCCYFWGRLRIAEGKPGIIWILLAPPLAILAFFGKENAALLPLLLLVSEITVLRTVSASNRVLFIRGIWVTFIVVPILASLFYFATHTGYFDYGNRPFTLEERVLTQARVLWFYAKWIFIPDISAFSLFHDDIEISTGLANPQSTWIAVTGIFSILAGALLLRRKMPIFSFSVLFFLANHALESSIFPLELVYEHRNYLASVGPLLLLAYLVTIASARLNVRKLAISVGFLLVASYAHLAYMRVDNWSSYESFVLSSVVNHPESARSNFTAGQIMIAALSKNEGEASEIADAARLFFSNGIAAEPRCINCMFGLIVLDLHLGRQPSATLISSLTNALREGFVGPTKVSISQFSYLVKWHLSDGTKLPPGVLESIFEAALTNTAWVRTGRAGIEAAYRKYWEEVADDLPKALIHAQEAVRLWPGRWSYHMNVVELLYELGRQDEALVALDEAEQVADNQTKQFRTKEARARIEQKLWN